MTAPISKEPSYDFTSTLQTGGAATSTHVRPDNVGTSATIPDDICTISRITNKKDIVAWTKLDPVYRDGSIGRFTCCQHFGLFAMIPCFWPHMLILSPCLLASKIASDNVIESTYWILTVSELKIVVLSYNACCYREGDTVKSIPLDTITDCGTSAANTGCGGGCADVPTIYVDTASSGHSNGPRHEAVGYALAGYDWFISEILSRRSAQYRGANHPITVNNINANVMDRGSSITESSLENRILKLKEAQTLGIITDEEFEKKRLEIIASI